MVETEDKETIEQNYDISHENFITLQQVMKRIGLSKSAIYRRLSSKEELYDPTFPRPVVLGQSTKRWLESEIHTWMKAQIDNRKIAA
ncbi:AlpA family phage regulatory protein [Thiomicrorhabdus xiamenensis]|uniref:AlpA family phage regulatory protein n=2 Tax=Thiomicrorhabdus xiamenensis TaxID=2739063 RepID=A0A7D4NT37_9GAMM|nr:AlpA family phage regulatory protein [Thiomicrorhabdus xiamenensis]